MLASPRPALLAAALSLAFAPLGGCGDDPAPAPAPAAPDDFDDPFADDAENAEAPAAPGANEAEPEPAAADAPPAADPALADAVEAESDGAAPEPADAADVDEAAPADEPAAKSTTTRSKKPAKPAESDDDAKADADARPEPAPAPEPAAEVKEDKEETKVVEPRPAAETKPPPPPQARLAGEYRYVGGAAQKQRLADAIDQAVQQLNALIRNIGRRRLTESNQVRDAIKIAVDGDRVTTIFVPGGTVTATLGGPQVDWTTDTGAKVKAKVSLVKGRLVQEFKGEDGSRRNVFTLDASGDKMTLSVTISASRLKTPMKYALSYKRK